MDDDGLRVDRLTDEDTGINTVLLNPDQTAFSFLKTAPNQTSNLAVEVAKIGIPFTSNINYILAVVNDQTTAIEGKHFSLNRNGVIDPGKLISNANVIVELDSLEVGEIYTLTLQLESADIDFREGPVTYTFELMCEGDLSTTYTFVNEDTWMDGPFSGTGELSGGDGEYEFSDFSFGAWAAVYMIDPPSGSLKFVENCGIIGYTGLDNFNGTWTVEEVISSGGPEFSFKWSNTYGEFGTVTLTKDDGTDWPLLQN